MRDEDQQEDPTAKGAWRTVEFWLLLTAALCAMFGLPASITIPVTLAGLSLSSLPVYVKLWPRARDAGAEREWCRTVALSLLNGFAASAGAHVAGVMTRWIWL